MEVPQYLKAEQTDGVSAAETTDDYVVLDVYGDTTQETIDNHFNTNLKAKVVFHADFDSFQFTQMLLNHYVILDLNGQIIKLHSPYGEIFLRYLEIRDDSPDGNGRIDGGIDITGGGGTDVSVAVYGGTIDYVNLDNAGYNQTFNLYGGQINRKVTFIYYNADTTINTFCNIYGGLLIGGISTKGLDKKPNLTIAPYINATYDSNGNLTSAITYDYYAVSTSDLISGAYNTAYNLAWDISVEQLNHLEIPTDKIYYLWGRIKDNWYRYYGLKYVNGELVKV